MVGRKDAFLRAKNGDLRRVADPDIDNVRCAGIIGPKSIGTGDINVSYAGAIGINARIVDPYCSPRDSHHYRIPFAIV